MRRIAAIWLGIVVLGANGAGPVAAERTAQIFSVSFGSQYTKDDFRRMAERLDLLIIDPLSFPTVPRVLREVNPNIKVLGYRNTFDIRDMTP
ncbi:MAG: hypothetical protein ACE5JM_15245, partial [Armatimonadota bacterium]